MHIDRTEKTFFIISFVMILVFATAVAISGVVYGITLPEPVDLGYEVNPQTVATDPESPWSEQPADARLHEIAPGKYEVYILAQTWTFLPNRITIPRGSSLTLYITSKDVVHGFKLWRTNASMMVIPGEVSKLTVEFDEPGTYTFVCHEYCGAGHHTMYGEIIVE